MKTIFASIALIGAFATAPEDARWRKITAPIELAFPRDHGSHEDCRTEWWYATGIVADVDDGARFGWQLTIFRRGLQFGPPAFGDPALAPRQVFAGHLAVVDLTTGTLVTAERVRRAFQGLAYASTSRLDVVLEGWTFALDADDTLRVRALDRTNDLSLDLVLAPEKALVLQGNGGVSTKGPEYGNSSGYVSWTRMRTSGTIERSGVKRRVEGESWFDHEWGSSQLAADVVGWDWFGLRLDDGRELMIYRLRRTDGGVLEASSGTLVGVDGSAQHIRSADFALVDTNTWKSSRSGAQYPARFSLKVPTLGIDVVIETEIPDCEIDARASTGTIYWEGPVKVRGSVGGSGYGELTGYAAPMTGKL